MNHKCPAWGCKQRVPSHELACFDHWLVVSVATRARIWRAWRRGQTDEHLAAVKEAIDEMNAKQERATP